ncbi:MULTISPECIES: phage protease [unclassified Psychrobacter]|uniref:phage protease n=1 Tax=unclassified Psychrobacter TaxID=196806 RepID=UPI0018F5C5AD|nr:MULTISPECIES: phage protease [unclassified Psychrobacter]
MTKPTTAATIGSSTHIAALSLEITASRAPQGYFLVFPEGKTRSGDGSGRPTECDAWQLDASNGYALADLLNARPTDMVIDYEHQTLHAQSNGQPAPAAGWLAAGQFEYVDGVGLCNRAPSWTTKATKAIADHEYRYKSPVIVYDTDGYVTNVMNVAITNQPALLTLDELTALSAKFTNSNPKQQDTEMKPLLAYIVAALGLPATTTEDEAVTALSAQVDDFKAKAVTAKVDVDADKPLAALSSVFAHSAEPDPAKYVPVATMTETVAALNAQITELQGNQVDPTADLLTAALSDGRLLPAQAEWAKSYAKSDPAGFKAYLDNAPRIAALNQRQTEGKPDPIAGNKVAALSAEQKEVAVALGLSDTDMLAQLNA